MRLLAILLSAALMALASGAHAQEREVPYWASIRATELNMRVGPSQDYKIAWVYRRQGLPVKVVRIMEGWRLIEDPDGERGWVVARLLSPDQTAIVTGVEEAPIRSAPSENSDVKWRAARGVIGSLGECDAGWCEFDVDGREGWVRAGHLWGADKP